MQTWKRKDSVRLSRHIIIIIPIIISNSISIVIRSIDIILSTSSILIIIKVLEAGYGRIDTYY